MQHGQSHRLEENPDFRIERGTARNHRLDTSAEPLADLGLEQTSDDRILDTVTELRLALCPPLADAECSHHQLFRQATLLGDLLHYPRA